MLIDKVNITKSDSTRKPFRRRVDITDNNRIDIAIEGYKRKKILNESILKYH